MGWLADAKRPVLDVARELGLEGSQRGGLPCPACGQEKRDRSRGAVGVGRDGLGWKCHLCNTSGDGIDFVAYKLHGCRFRDLDPQEKTEVRVWFESRGWAQPEPPTGEARKKEAPLVRPPADEVKALWDASLPLASCRIEDQRALEFLTHRGLEPLIDVIDAVGLARLTPQPGDYRWPPWWPRGRADLWRLLVRAFDAKGNLVSLQARALEERPSFEDREAPRQLWPGSEKTGRYDAARLFFADAAAQALLRGEADPRVQKLLVCEGLTDWLAASAWCRGRGRDDIAVLGGVSGSFPALRELTLPEGVEVIVATDPDHAGEKYHEEIRAAFPGRPVRRVRPNYGDVGRYLAGGDDLGLLMGEKPVADVPQASEVTPHANGDSTAHAPGIFVQDGATWHQYAVGEPSLVVPYGLIFHRDTRSPDGRILEGEVVARDMPALPFAIPAEILGDGRAFRKTLAGLLGTRFRNPPEGTMDELVDAWLEASTVEERVVLHDFGFTEDGRRFVDRSGSRPNGNLRFGPPSDSAASRLALRAGAQEEARSIARDLLELWPQVIGCPATVATLLGVVGWGLVAPVLEAREPGVSPLLAFLVGRSGAGKSTHASVVQCFFGAFADTRAAVSFSSTPLSIELEGYLFRGAVMVVGDVKASTIAEGGASRVLGLIQRAGDRAERRRLDAGGHAQPCRRSRATWLFEGEDVPVSDSSAIARLLVMPLPEGPRSPETLGQLQHLQPRLPVLTTALVDFLLATQPWATLLDHYRDLSNRLAASVRTASNGVRLAKHIAAVALGLEVWSLFLASLGLAPPVVVEDLVSHLLAATANQLAELEQATPAERFLELVRQMLASGLARLGDRDESGEIIGQWNDAGTVAYLLPDAVLGRLKRHFPDAAAGLAPAASIAADLARMEALADHDPDRRTKKVRIGGKAVNCWAVKGEEVGR